MSNLPKIPTIKFVVTRPNPNDSLPEREEFESWREFEDWACDECDKELYSFYRFDVEPFERRGCQDMREFVRYVMDTDHIIEFVEDKGWKFHRVVTDDKSNEVVRGC